MTILLNTYLSLLRQAVSYKKTYILSIMAFLLVHTSASSQRVRFTDTTNVWYSVNSNPMIPPSARFTRVDHFVRLDTINGMEYKLFTFGYLREDTISKILYAHNPTGQDKVIFNFSLKVGDTFTRLDQIYGDVLSTITCIDSIKVNGYWHIVQCIDPSINVYVIEGIGSTYTPLEIPMGGPDLWYSLSCFENNGIRPQLSKPVAQFDNKTSCTLGINYLELETSKLFIHPNPANSYVLFDYKLLNKTDNLRLVIASITGKIIKEIGINTNNSVGQVRWDTESSPSGVYVYKLTDGTTLYDVGKIVLAKQ